MESVDRKAKRNQATSWCWNALFSKYHWKVAFRDFHVAQIHLLHLALADFIFLWKTSPCYCCSFSLRILRGASESDKKILQAKLIIFVFVNQGSGRREHLTRLWGEPRLKKQTEGGDTASLWNWQIGTSQWYLCGEIISVGGKGSNWMLAPLAFFCPPKA